LSFADLVQGDDGGSPCSFEGAYFWSFLQGQEQSRADSLPVAAYLLSRDGRRKYRLTR
jgi:hypothetical protein